MRVIGGKYKNKKLKVISNSLLRPSSDYLKEVLFNVITHRYHDFLKDKHFLDIFSGTGSIAIEALSRGAQSITLVEQKLTHCKLSEKNLTTLPYTIINKDFLATKPSMFPVRYSLVFLDPPYHLNLLPEALRHLVGLKILKQHAIVVTESKKNTFQQSLDCNFLSFLGLELLLTKVCGNKELHFFSAYTP